MSNQRPAVWEVTRGRRLAADTTHTRGQGQLAAMSATPLTDMSHTDARTVSERYAACLFRFTSF